MTARGASIDSDRQPIWLIPTVDAPVHLSQSIEVLDSRKIPYVLVDHQEVRQRLPSALARAAIVHGGPISPLLLEVQRWLLEFQVPTLLLVEDLTDVYEAILIDRGAQDTLSLPASPHVLGSRVRALTRVAPAAAHRAAEGRLILSSSVLVDLGRRVVEVRGEDLRLTKSQFEVFLTLALRPGQVVTREEIAQEAGLENMTSRSLESHVSRLRARLRQAGEPADALHAVRGIGYVLDLSGEKR